MSIGLSTKVPLLISNVLSISTPPDAALISARLIMLPPVLADQLTTKVMVLLIDAQGASVPESVLNAILPESVQDGSLSVSPVGM